MAFRDIIIKANGYYQSQELQLLIEKVSNAISENKYLIHYGIYCFVYKHTNMQDNRGIG